MAVPKRKTSKSRRDRRSSCKFIRPQIVVKCKNCDRPILPHIVCASCGYYKGRKILSTKIERLVKRGEKKSKKEAKNTNQDINQTDKLEDNK